MTDIRHTVRSLTRNPGFTVVAVLTLALGIGANVAVFSVVDAVLFRPLPYRDADRLVQFISIQEAGTPRQRQIIGMTRTEVDVWRGQTHIFEAIETSSSRRAVIDGDDPQRVDVGQLSSGMLDFLGETPVLGRGFLPEESIAGSAGVVLIGERMWKARFGADRNVLGRTISLDRRPHTIVGVLRDSFRFENPRDQIWVPLPSTRTAGEPGTSFVGPLARLIPELSLEEAQRRIDAVSARLVREQPRKDGWTTRLVPLDRMRVDDSTGATLVVLLGAVGFVILIASANVANLFLARNINRQREIAVRAAIGASWVRLVRQFLVEGLVVAALGTLVAMFAASWAIQALGWVSDSILEWPTVFDPELNGRVLVFMVCIAAMAGLACALVPGLNVVTRDLHSSFLGSTRVIGFTPRHRRISQTLALVEVALTFALLLGAGLLANSFIRRVSVDPGFDTRNLLTIDLELPAHRYSNPTAHDTAYNQLVESISTLPGVLGVMATGAVPPNGMFVGGTLTIDGESTARSGGSSGTSLTYAAPGHFEFLKIPLIAGRTFTRSDLSGPPVAIVSEETVRRYWPDGKVLGQRVRAHPADEWRTVVGVVGRTLRRDEPDAQIFLPLTIDEARGASPIVRFNGRVETLIPLLRERIRAFDREIIVSNITTVDENYGELFARPRVFLMLMSVFAFVALALAVVGLYGVLAYFVNQRTREIGIRIALGARREEVRGMVVREAMVPVVAGLGIGLAASFWLNRFLTALLFGITPHDPTTIAGVAALMLAVAAVAALLPANRAARVDPVAALRAE